MSALIAAFPAIPITQLTEDFNYETSWKPKCIPPAVNGGILPTSTTISGTSLEPNGTVITVFKNGTALSPTITVTNNTWTLTGVSGLVLGDAITARASTSDNSKNNSDLSNTVFVSQAVIPSCYTPPPVITAGNNGSRQLTISWSLPSGYTITSTSVIINVYLLEGTGANPIYTFIGLNPTTYYPTSGTLTYSLGGNGNITGQYVAEAIWNGCSSGYGNSVAFNSSTIGTTNLTTAPTINTNPINVSSTPQSIQVTNVHTANAVLTLYLNGTLIRTSTVVAGSASFTFTNISGLSAGDIITARAQGQVSTDRISILSNAITVGGGVQTLAPVITGTYAAGTNITITGTSTEAAGTVITILNNGSPTGTATVSAFGTWQLTGQTLVAGNVLTATAKASSKSTSAVSNSVTVQATAPAAPSISGEYTEGQTTITGTAGNTLVEVFVDGDRITQATPTSGNWSATVSSTDLYRGAQITARNVVNGVRSSNSAPKTVTGVVRFCITQADGSALPATIPSGQTLAIRITAVSNDACPGTTFTGFTGTVNLSSNVMITPEVSGNFVNGVWTGNMTLGGTGTANIFVNNTANPTTTGSASITINTNAIWSGANSTDFNTASNWSGGYVPGPGANITFANNVQRDLHLDTNRLIGDLDFNSSAPNFKVVVGSNTLEVRGNILNANANKSITTSSGSKVTLSGYGASSPVFFTSGSTIDELTLNKTNSGAITIGSPIRVLSILRVVNGTLTTNGNITLASTATKTAVVPTVGGNIVGNVTVEKYIPARRAFRFLTSTVNTTTSINANWQEGQANASTSSNSNTTPGYGTHITGNGQNGFDATNTTNYSMFTYNNATAAWANVTNTNSDNLVAGRAYRILIRGDRSINLNVNNPTATPTTLRATGALVVGNHTIPAASLNQNNNAYSFIGNPYHARVNMREVLKGSGFQRKVWYWNPNYGAAGRGAYVSVDFSNGITDADDLVSIPTATNSSIVAPFAAFFVRKSGGTSSDNVFRESHKMSETSNSTLFRNASSSSNNDMQRIALSLHETGNVLASDNTLDGTLVVFNQAFDSNFTEDDMPKFSNLDEDLAVKYDNSRVSIDKRDIPVSSDVIQLDITKYRYTNYRLNIDLTNYNGLAPYLVDQFLNTLTPLVPGSSHSYSFSIQSSVVASTNANRFKIVFDPTVLGTPNFENPIVLYPNPGDTTTGFTLQGVLGADILLHNYLGQQLPIVTSEELNATQVKPTITLNQGVYLVTVNQGGKISQFKWIVK
ncbi:T9SS type A sorting domain-containing protein [Flavobacterium sp.]|uniref:T9SS type A sorting domain-containing protein n=1 Tax=Flavobacterium sp. TaxID=239 RepID=UPI0035AEF1E2